ncbi:hypothetical protein HYW83_01685 [Candidatus Peregrinibacteria bacterium]|nr:hypothetical protein [Candidatus Peregrinibacteria bacterium]
MPEVVERGGIEPPSANVRSADIRQNSPHTLLARIALSHLHEIFLNFLLQRKIRCSGFCASIKQKSFAEIVEKIHGCTKLVEPR